MPGVKGKSGGKRPGAGRKPTKRTKTIELTEAATRDLAYFIDNLNLDPRESQQIVSTILTAACDKLRGPYICSHDGTGTPQLLAQMSNLTLSK